MQRFPKRCHAIIGIDDIILRIDDQRLLLFDTRDAFIDGFYLPVRKYRVSGGVRHAETVGVFTVLEILERDFADIGIQITRFFHAEPKALGGDGDVVGNFPFYRNRASVDVGETLLNNRRRRIRDFKRQIICPRRIAGRIRHAETVGMGSNGQLVFCEYRGGIHIDGVRTVQNDLILRDGNIVHGIIPRNLHVIVRGNGGDIRWNGRGLLVDVRNGEGLGRFNSSRVDGACEDDAIVFNHQRSRVVSP